MNAKFKLVIILAPSHHYAFKDRIVSPAGESVSTPLGEIAVDQRVREKLSACFRVDSYDSVHQQEHAAQIEYPLLQYALKDFKILPLIVSDLSEAALESCAAALKKIIDSETLLIISSDFTHYGKRFEFAPFREAEAQEKVAELDRAVFDTVAKHDLPGFLNLLDNSGATVCGRKVLELMLHLIPDNTGFELLHYATSAEHTGEKSDFVGYLCAAGYADFANENQVAESSSIHEAFLTAGEKELLLSMAERSIEYSRTTRKILPADTFELEATPNLRKKMGCFVTLKLRSTGELHGCIGEIEPCRPLYQAVTERAVDSAFRDPRFAPFTSKQWDDIRIEISVLTPASKVNSYHDIVIGRHGMTIRKYGRTAVFLPQVALEQNWDLPTTLTHLCLKAGLSPDDWKSGAEFTVFEAIVFSQK